MKYVFLGVIVFCLFVYLFVVIGWMYGYSDGERTGEVYKFSKKGLIFKSWEGEMYLGGVLKNSEGGLVLDKFYFSIPESEASEKADLIVKLQECGRDRAICTIKYNEWLKGPIYISSGYVVVGVEKQ